MESIERHECTREDLLENRVILLHSWAFPPGPAVAENSSIAAAGADHYHSALWSFFHHARCGSSQRRPRSGSLLRTAEDMCQVYFWWKPLLLRLVKQSHIYQSGRSFLILLHSVAFQVGETCMHCMWIWNNYEKKFIHSFLTTKTQLQVFDPSCS